MTSLRGGGAGLFHFAGHGVQSKGRNCLLPVSADVQNGYGLEDESVDAILVLGAMDEAQTRVNIVILDACRNNPFAKSFRSAQRGLAQMEAARIEPDSRSGFTCQVHVPCSCAGFRACGRG